MPLEKTLKAENLSTFLADEGKFPVVPLFVLVPLVKPRKRPITPGAPVRRLSRVPQNVSLQSFAVA